MGFDRLALDASFHELDGGKPSSSSGLVAGSATRRPRRAEKDDEGVRAPTRRAFDASSSDARREADARASGAPEAAAVANISRRRWDRAGAPSQMASAHGDVSRDVSAIRRVFIVIS